MMDENSLLQEWSFPFIQVEEKMVRRSLLYMETKTPAYRLSAIFSRQLLNKRTDISIFGGRRFLL